MAAFIVIKLKAGWVFSPSGGGGGGGSVRRHGLGLVTSLPAGAVLAPALPLPEPPRGRRGHRTPAERELSRYVHLQLPGGGADAAGDALRLARSWLFVDRAELVLEPADGGDGGTGAAVPVNPPAPAPGPSPG